MTTATYIPNKGIVLTIQGIDQGLSITLPVNMTIAAIQSHAKEVLEWLA